MSRGGMERQIRSFNFSTKRVTLEKGKAFVVPGGSVQITLLLGEKYLKGRQGKRSS